MSSGILLVKKQKCWIWIAYDRDGRRVCAFWIGRRGAKDGSQLHNQIKHLEIQHVCTDDYPAYRRAIGSHHHVVTKAETCAIEALNSLIRHYLARLKRKTFCYSKSIAMVAATLSIFFSPHWESYL